MADDTLGAAQPEELTSLWEELGAPEGFETEQEPERRWKHLLQPFRRLRDLLVWLWERLAYGWRWLRKPDEMGHPLTLQPHGVRLLALLVTGNLVILIVLTVALFRTSALSSLVLPPQIVVATPTPGPSPTPQPEPTPLGSGGSIAFTMRRNGNDDIYALNQDTLQVVRLTYDPAEDRDPTWSPDGNYVAFASNRAHNWDIYVLDLASGALIRQTHDQHYDGNPSWSPDGEWIAFESYRRGNLDIYLMSTSGGQVQRLTRKLAPEYAPAWSPDSRAIAYTSYEDGNKDIHVTFIEEGKQVNITNSPDLDEDEPAWSPDGTQLAYVSGSRGDTSLHVATLAGTTSAVERTQTELFGTGASPAWAPDGQSLIYTLDRGAHSHLIAASTTDWALFHQVYSIEGQLDDLTWSSIALSPRVVARAQGDTPARDPALYTEVAKPTPISGPPYALVEIPGVTVNDSGADEEPTAEPEVKAEDKEAASNGDGEAVTRTVTATGTSEAEATRSGNGDAAEDREPAYLSDRVNESFNALRQRVIDETGSDILARLDLAQLPMDFTPYSGHSRMSWHVCGRAIGLDHTPYDEVPPLVELIREEAGNVTYWRVLVRAAEQDGSMGEPLRQATWDLSAREEGGTAMVEGGMLREQVPAGYYVDFTTLVGDYGWERVPALWRWRYFEPDIRWWRFRKTDGLNWWDCMLELFDPEEIEESFGPIPGHAD